MRKLLLTAVFVAAAWYGWTLWHAPPPWFAVDNASDASRPLVVKIHADFCPTCIALDSTWSQLDARVGDGARMVVLDVTNEERFQDTVRIARYMGLGDFLEKHMEDTGTIAILHGATREPLATFHGERDLARYLSALERARRS